MHTCMHTHTHAHTHVCMHITHIYKHTHIHRTHVHKAHIHIPACTLSHTHTYACMHAHTLHTHSYIYTLVLSFQFFIIDRGHTRILCNYPNDKATKQLPCSLLYHLCRHCLLAIVLGQPHSWKPEDSL